MRHYVETKRTVKEGSSIQVRAATEERGQGPLQAGQFKEAYAMIGIELDEQVEIARRVILTA